MSTDTLVKSSAEDLAVIAQLFEKEVSYIHDPLFDKPKTNFSEYPLDIEPVWTWANALLGEFVEDSDETKPALVLLDKSQEREIFLHMNWHLCQWSKIQKRVEAKTGGPTKKQLADAKMHRDAAYHAREQIALFNLGLIFGVCKKFDRLRQNKNLTSQDRWTEALTAMLRTIDKFNVQYGYKFSTYFYNAAFNSLSRLSRKEDRINGRFIPASKLAGSSDEEYNVDGPLEEGSSHIVRRETLEQRFSKLDPRIINIVFQMLLYEPEGASNYDSKLTAFEKSSFILRYGSEEKYTLEQIADLLGKQFRGQAYTKERARQGSMNAIKKIRDRIEEEFPGEMPALLD